MFNRKYFSSVTFFLFIALFISLSLGAQDESRAASKPASYESYCPYQTPPEDLPKAAMPDAPKLTNKGDFYFSKKGKVNLLRSRNQIAITGEPSRIEQIIKGAKKGKVHEKKKLGKQKNTYLYTFQDVGEEDLAEEIINKLKSKSEVQFISPVFYSKQGGLSMILTDEITVKLKEGYSENDLLAVNPPYIEMRKAGKFRKNVYLLSVEGAKEKDLFEIAQWYKGLDIIEWSHPVFLCEIKLHWEPNDPFFSEQWHLKNTGQGGGSLEADVDANQAWDLTHGNSNIVVAVLDNGVQTNHPDLAANIWTNPNAGAPDVHGWNFYDDSNVVDPIDTEDNHGTACAGVIAACNNTLGGIGISPQTTILPIKILEGDYSICSHDKIADAISYAAQYADILSCSWSLPQDFPDVESAIQNAVQNGRGGKGCQVFFSTSNYADGFEKLIASEHIIPGTFLPGSSFISPDWHTYGFVYRKDTDGVSGGEDSVWIDYIDFPNGEREYFGDGIPQDWSSGAGWNGPYPPTLGTVWYEVDDDRHYFIGADVKSAKSGDIWHDQYTYLEVTKYNATAGDLRLFYWNSVDAYGDKFEFWIDGILIRYENGSTDVQTTPHYPARYDETIAVGASTNYNYRSCYSQYGSQLDFVAPSNGGTLDIYTTDRTGSDGYSSGDYTDTFGGTSAACPLAAGIAALILSREPDLTWGQVRQRMRDTADKIGPVSYSNGRNDYFGYGKVNAYMALTPDLDPPADVQASDGLYTNKVIITWSAVLGAMGYDIYRADFETGVKTLIASWHTATEYTDTTMKLDVQHYYWVKAVNERVESEFSAYDIGWYDPIRVYPGGSIQSAIDGCQEDDLIVVYQGTYTQRINFSGKAITIKSTDPDDPNVVANTILDGNRAGSVVTFNHGEGNDSVLEGVTIQNGYSSYGGGVYCYNASPTINKCIIMNNEARYCGGGIRSYYMSSPVISRCTIKNNNSGYYGGGMECYYFASAVITNCVISGNSARYYGGAVEFYYYSSAVITNCTITGNSVDYGSGGGFWFYYSSATISNCILWNDSHQEIYVYSGNSPTVSYSDVQGGYTGTGNINDDPLFINAGAGNYRLHQTSPCLNSGTAGGAPDTDKDGLPRPIDAGYDMGAYECRIESHVYSGQSIQAAIDSSEDWYVIVVHPGAYYENIDFSGKLITLMSVDPDDPAVVNTTIIDGGNADSVIEFVNGEGSNSVLTGFTIRNGYADNEGGGIYCYSSSPTISNCTITGNAADWAGGGIGCVYDSSPSIINCTVTGNSSEVGGGIYFYNSVGATITNCSIIGNAAGFIAGGIFYYKYSSSTVTNCAIADNTATMGGGIVLLANCSSQIINCAITKNLATSRSGGIECMSESSLTVINSTLEGNSGPSGGAINGRIDQSVIVTNCILWNNSPVEISGDATFTVTYSDIEGGFSGTGNINGNPLFLNSGAGDYHLQAASPCIDTGTNDGAPATDKDGVSRPQDGDGIGEAICDMGAYEFVN